MTPVLDRSKQQTFPMRWCIFIDILGFSRLWESEQTKALRGLGELMRAIYRIGTLVYNSQGERLFVHHMGDGFAIVSDFGEASFERPLSITATLMRHMASTGMFAAAAIAEGDFSDITGCYPNEVTEDCEDGNTVCLGEGLMTLSSVMGTAFIRAYRLHGETPSGPYVALSTEHKDRIPPEFECRSARGRRGNALLSIDWMRADTPAVARIQDVASLQAPTVEELIQSIKSYCTKYPDTGCNWSDNLRDLLSVDLQNG